MDEFRNLQRDFVESISLDSCDNRTGEKASSGLPKLPELRYRPSSLSRSKLRMNFGQVSAIPCSISRFIRRRFRFVVIAIASHAAPALHNRIVNVKTISTDILTLLEKPWCPACVFKNATRMPPQDGSKWIKSYCASGKGSVEFVRMSHYS